METTNEIVLDGRWTMLDRPNRRWQGIVRTPSPVAVLLAAISPGRIVWAKSVSYSLELLVLLDVHELRPPNNVQLILRVGDGWIQDVSVELEDPDALPACTAPTTLTCGSFQKLFLPFGSPSTALGLLLLPRASVRVGRTGIWKLRDGFEDQVPREFVLFAKGGRIGDSLADGRI